MRVEKIDIAWNPRLPIFASEAFLNAVGDDYGWLGGIDDAGNVRCILPYTVVRKSIIRMVRFRVETIPCGGGIALEEERSFLNSVVQHFRSIGAGLIIPATTNTIFRTYPDGAVAVPYGTYVVDLTQNEDVLWSRLSSSHRRKVRLAMKSGVTIKSGGECARTAFELVRDTFWRSKIPFMKYESFSRYLLGLGENVMILIAEHQGSVQGCVVIPYSSYGGYYVYGGSIPSPVAGAMNLLHWEAMTQLKALGASRYDFVGVRIAPRAGSKQEGLRHFKERFGGRLLEGYMWKSPIIRSQYAIYSSMVRLLRGGDIVDAERRVL